MKKLNVFERFDAQAFLKGKTLLFISGKYEDSDRFKGCKIEVLIANDMTNYNGEVGVNIYERMVIKVPDTNEDYLKQFKLNDEVYIENPTMRVWGNNGLRNNLSVIGHVKKVSK